MGPEFLDFNNNARNPAEEAPEEAEMINMNEQTENLEAADIPADTDVESAESESDGLEELRASVRKMLESPDLSPEDKERVEMISEEDGALSGLLEKSRKGVMSRSGKIMAMGLLGMTLLCVAPKESEAGQYSRTGGKSPYHEKHDYGGLFGWALDSVIYEAAKQAERDLNRTINRERMELRKHMRDRNREWEKKHGKGDWWNERTDTRKKNK
jgi:hypothetical protein